MKVLFYSLIFFSFYLLSNQKNDFLIQFSGLINSQHSEQIIPFTTVYNASQKKVFIANQKAFFSLVVKRGDTIFFHSIGYEKYRYIIPQDISKQRYDKDIKLVPLVEELPEVRVFPWASQEDFDREFMDLYYVSDAVQFARENLSKEKLAALIENLPKDGAESNPSKNKKIGGANVSISKKQSSNFSYDIKNPEIWVDIINKISRGDKKRNKSVEK